MILLKNSFTHTNNLILVLVHPRNLLISTCQVQGDILRFNKTTKTGKLSCKQKTQIVSYLLPFQLSYYSKNDSAQQLVLYNESDKSLQVQDSPSILHEIENDEKMVCGECGRPWPLKHHQNDNFDVDSRSFMDRNYFRLLDISSKQQEAITTPSKAFKLQYTTTTSENKRKSGRLSPLSSHQTTIEELETFAADDDIKFHPKNLSDSSINQGYYRRFFREDVKLGRGAGGSVFKCQHVLDGIELGAYAVKKVPVGDNHAWLNRMLREVHILENLRHSNIIEYKHAWLEYNQLTPFGPPIPCLFILMQLAEGGNLEEFVLGNIENFDVSLYCDWFEQICLGLAHLHRCGILHRDLKPSNILLKVAQEGKVQLLITDFGECTSEQPTTTTTTTTTKTAINTSTSSAPADHNRTGATGTIEFVAPELLKVDRKSGLYLYQHSKSTDIWSLGLIFYFMLTGKLPYANIDDLDILKSAMCSLKQVNLPKEANKLPRGFRKALGAMFQVDPELRPSIEQVLILIRENDSSANISKVKKQATHNMTLPLPPIAKVTSESQPHLLDENTRISLALIMICVSVIPTYPKIPSFRRIVLALAFTFALLKTSKQRTAIILLSVYFFLISVFYLNKID